MLELSGSPVRVRAPSAAEVPILISLFGGFRVLKAGQPVTLRQGGRPESFLCSLALCLPNGILRDRLVCALWPDREAAQATQSLNSLVHTLQKLLGDVLGGSALVLHERGRYRLNTAAGVDVDVARFEALADAGDQLRRAGQGTAALSVFRRAVELYRGDLCVGSDTQAAVERERLRERYLTLLTRLADYAFEMGDYAGSLDQITRLLSADPCREDAHRKAMRCYVRLGERSRALRQFRLCEAILREEFGAVPEPMTQALFDHVRLDPSAV